MNYSEKKQYTLSQKIKFFLPSLLGLFLFVIPLQWGTILNIEALGSNFTIGVGAMAEMGKVAIGESLPFFMTWVIVVSAVVTMFCTIFKPQFIKKDSIWNKLFVVTPLWLFFRVIGAIFAIVTYYSIGSEVIYSRATGGTMIFDLMPTLATWFFFSGFFLPFLMNFGLMDFFGTMIRRIMRPLFRVPGRAAIDGITSWIGSGPVGVVLTDKQYKQGYYTAKEASIIAVCFSLVSLPFAVVVANFLDLAQYFPQFYLTICLVSLVAAVILPRIWPLTIKEDVYHPKAGKQINEEVPENYSQFEWALANGYAKAETANSLGEIIKDGIMTVIDVYVTLMPLVMCWGTFALILTEYTPIFEWLAVPLIPIFKLLQVPEASLASQATLLGFADMFLPSVIVSSVSSELTRFVVGVMSFSQLIYMSETGAVILNSEIPLDLKDLFIIFVERTIITLPLAVLLAHLFL
ncbi:YjiH family protein [Facklamia sp. DSM 111018]|uniref:YjiH family protein n=2 Tax=Facklamia lactis TaxID=2749967 RepID=A0ABS0LSM8_9LACT|nr:YjiH family protein [Facklamia lactis]MBG9981356.1 YjiH family protein [Facklamia lactis]MBG9987168.1 YjiH family protein [Facklamia lactis]